MFYYPTFNCESVQKLIKQRSFFPQVNCGYQSDYLQLMEWQF